MYNRGCLRHPRQKLAETLIRVILNNDHLYVGGDVSSWPRFSLDPQIVVLTQFRLLTAELIGRHVEQRKSCHEEVLLLSGTTVTRGSNAIDSPTFSFRALCASSLLLLLQIFLFRVDLSISNRILNVSAVQQIGEFNKRTTQSCASTKGKEPSSLCSSLL